MRCGSDLAERFAGNPILSPADVPPSRPGLEVAGVLNPGAFRWRGRTWLLLRVAERAIPEPGGSRPPSWIRKPPGDCGCWRYRMAIPTWASASRAASAGAAAGT